MDTFKWIVLFVTTPAVLCTNTFSLGENCTTSCDVLHSLCENNECVCEKNYIEFNGECAAGLGAKCNHDEDCKLSNTICSTWDDECMCNPNFVADPDKSICLSKLADNCTKAEECFASDSECKNGHCQCLSGRSLVDGECVYKLGSYCEKFSNCGIQNSECLNEKCTCSPHYFELSGQCATGLGAKCYYDRDCELNNTICSSRDDTCVCDSNFVADANNSICLSKLADNCTKAEECLAPYSECKDGRCQCLPGRSLVDGECVHKLGSYCEKFSDCAITNGDCFDNKCSCYPHYFELSGQCVAGVNATCYHDHQCKAKNSLCLENKCQCQENFAATPDYQCLPIAHHHKPCKYDSQCSTALPHTSCNATDEGQRCECTAKYFFKEGECYPRKYVADQCDRWDDCFTPNSYCRNGLCACLPSYKLEDGACNSSSTIAQSLFFVVALVVLGMGIMS